MSQKSIVLIVILFILIVAGMFIFAYLKQGEVAEEPAPSTPEQVDGDTEEAPDPYADITRVSAKHYFIDGTHTLVGEINMPTPCDLLEAEATVMESMPEQIHISFSVINNADMCAQVITPQRFKVSAEASEAATFTAEFMGRPIELNLIPAAPGEVPEDFEVFIKG